MNGFYYPEIIDASFRELINFSKWLNRFHGHYPSIVGGWAVWAYTKGLGSRDIDVVFPDSKTMHSVLLNYFNRNGFERARGMFAENYVKKIRFNGKIDEIFVDACTQKNICISEHFDVRIPWNLVAKNNELFKLEKDAFIYIPVKELLLTQKIKALLDRSKTLALQPESAYYQAKVWKDKRDILSLLKLDLDENKLSKFLKESKLKQYITQAKEKLETAKELIKELKVTNEDLNKLI